VTRTASALLLSVCTLFVFASQAHADSITSADLQIQGVGLKVVTVSATTGIDIPAAIQTEFGGKQNDEAAIVEGLLAVGEFSGPGIDAPIRLETAPGHKFQIPGLSREGVYFLQNIRLMKGTEFLQSATPSVATITVSNLLQTSVRVRQLTPEELRARGISIDARNYDVFEYTFSFLINGVIVEIPFPVIIDSRTHEVRTIPEVVPYMLPPVDQVKPPRWEPPMIETFELGAGPDLPQEQQDKGPKGGGGRISIPAALIIPNNLAVLHQFFAVTLMVTNGAPDGSTVSLDSVTAQIKPPAQLRTVKSNPSVAFNQPVPIVDATTGVTFLVAQARGEAEWTMEGLQPGTHTIEVDVRATYKSPGQTDFPLRGTARASVVVHDPRFNINFSHPDTVRKGLDYSTFSFITNMSGATQNIRVDSGLPACAESPLANVCRVDGTPQFNELSIPPGEMRTVEYKLRSIITGHVFATAGSVGDDNITASVQLHMGVSESGIPLSPATLVMPYYARFIAEPLVSANLQLLGLGYSLATAPLVPALAKHPRVLKTDVFHRAVDIARAGQRAFLGEPMRDSLAHMALDLLGNAMQLDEWDELRRQEKSGRSASAAIARELETHAQSDFVDRFATATAWRSPYLLALTNSGTLSVRDTKSNARLAVASEATAGWVRQLPFGELNTFQSGQLAMVGRWSDDLEITVTPTVTGALSLDVILPAANDGSMLRGHVSVNGTANQPLTLRVTRGATALQLLDALGGIAAVGTIAAVQPEPLTILGGRQDLNLDASGHKVSLLWSRPVGIAAGGDLLAKLSAQVTLDRDGVHYQGARPMSAAALQDGARVANVTFDHALSQNATYTMNVGSLVDPLSGNPVSFPSAVVPVIDNNAPGGILFGHVLKGDHTPMGDVEVRLYLEGGGGAPQYDSSRASDGAFLFEFVPRDIDNKLPGTYKLEAVTAEGKNTSVNGAVRLPGRVHFVDLVFLGHGSAEGYVRYDNGEVVKDARVVVGSTMFDEFRGATTDASGHYEVDDLPVGPLTFTATDQDGNITYAAGEIKVPGQLLQQDLSIYRRPFPGTATIRGVVRRSDTNAVVAGAHVGVYSQGYGLIDDFTDAAGRFEFTKVPIGFVTVLAAEWSVSRESAALDFDLLADETRDVELTLNVKPADPLAVVEGDVVREDPLFPGDVTKYQKVAGALVKIEGSQAVTADGNGHFIFPTVPVSFSGKKIQAYDPITTRTATTSLPQLDATHTNLVPIFIATANGYGEGTVRVRLLSAAGYPVSGYRVIVPGFPPEGPTELEAAGTGIYELKEVPVGSTTTIWAIGSGAAPYGDQTATGAVKVEFNGHVASLTLRLPGQGIVRTKLAADIDVIGDVKLVYPAWDETDQGLAPKERTASTSENGIAGFASFSAVPALQNFTVSSAHPVYGYASHSTKLGFDGDVQSIVLQLNKLSTVRGVVYAIDGRTPIPGAAVRIEDGRQNPGIFMSLPDGSFEFKNVAAGVGFRVIAEITQDGVYRTGVASGSTPSLGGPVNNVSVIMRTQGGIDGRIVYAGYKHYDPQNSANNVIDDTPNDLSDNAPVPLANFSLRELDFPYRNFGTLNEPITADIAGRFTFNNVFTGALRVTAIDPGNQEVRGSWTGTLSLEGQRISAIIGIGAEGFGPVSVRVADPNAQNAPVLNAEVTLVRDNKPFDLATTDGTGTVRFAEVPVGSYRVNAYSKALGKSGSSAAFNVVAVTGASLEVVLEFSGKVNGKLSDPEDANRGVPGAAVTLSASQYQTRASTDAAGLFVFDGVREGLFALEAKDTLTNRRATASHNLTQADPNPFISLRLEPTETLYLNVYLPNDTGGNSNVLVPLVNIDVTQRHDDFRRSLQGNAFAMPGLLENESYAVVVKELGGSARTITASNSFPTGNQSNTLKLVLPAYGAAEVHVVQSNAPAANARVTVSGGGKSVTVYTDAAGVAVAGGIPLGGASVQVVSVDNAFSGSTSTTIASQSTPAVVSITLGAYAGVTGAVEAETGGSSIGTRVIASFGRILEVVTDSNGRYTFNGIPTSTRVDLTYMGPNDITVGARQSVNIALSDASKIVNAPTVKLDATPPQVASIAPADGSANVSPDASMKITFTEVVQASQINTSFLQLIPADSTTPVSTSFTTQTNADGTFTVTMRPPNAPAGQLFPLKSNTLYRIIVSGEIRDLTGNKLPAPRGASFITSDYAEPHVIKVIPAVTSALQPAATFEFRFNEPIDPAPWQNGGSGQFHLYKISSAGPTGSVIAEKAGHAFLDPANPLALLFTPNDPIEQESFYRVVFSGVRDLQGNLLEPQTFHFFSYDLVAPFVTMVSPVPAEFPLISGVEYTLGVDLRNGSATAATATDVAKVDYFRVDGASATYLSTATSAPWSYRFVAPDAPAGGTLSLRAVAFDLSGNQSAPATIAWEVKPNAAPKDVTVTLTPADSIYPGNHVLAGVTFADEGVFATVQIDASATRTDGSAYTTSQVKNLTRSKVDDPWPSAQFDFDLPATLKQGTTATFSANVTDVRGLKGSSSASLGLSVDSGNPSIVSMAPAAQTRYNISDKYTITAVVTDLETGIAEVTFSFDGKTIKVPGTSGTKTGDHTWAFSSGQITVPAKNVDTTIAATVTAKDYAGNAFSKSTEIIYVGVNDPTVPKGAWLCPSDRAAYPAASSVTATLQVRATDDIQVTGVKFDIPGIAAPVSATRVGSTDVWTATTTLTMPAAGEALTLTATVSDANSDHDVALTLVVESVAIDITVDNRTQAITAADVATYANKSILVRGASAHLVPHVALTLKNLLVLDGGKVETLPTTTTVEQKLELTVTDHLYVDCASAIDVTAKGYLGGWGVNADGSNTKNEDTRGRTLGNSSAAGPSTFASASHGGVGGETGTGVTNAIYGSIINPTDLGTGGGSGASCCNAGASGGGAIQLRGGIVSVAGAIRADGGNRAGDGNAGAGGSININAAQVIAGAAARITANGGDDDGTNNASRGAGGGRIAVIAAERLDVETPGIQLQSRGGRNDNATDAASSVDGGSGTLYLRRPGQTLGELIVAAYDDRAPLSKHLTRPTPLAGTLQFERVTLGTRALVRADAALEIDGVVDDRSKATIDPTAVLVLQHDVPTITATTTPIAGSSLIQGATLSTAYTAQSAAGIGTVTLNWSPVTPNRVDSYFSYPATATPSPAVALSIPATTPVGAATLVLSTTDRAGRSATLAPIGFSIVANTAPIVDRFDVTPSLSVYPGTTLHATTAAHDDLLITGVTFVSQLGAGTPSTQTYAPNATAFANKTFDVAIPIATPGPQTLTLDLTVADNFPGRPATTQRQTVEILKDTIAPTVTIVTPVANALFNEGSGNTISVKATIADAEVGVKEAYVQLDGGAQITLTKSGNDWIATIPVPPVDGTDVVTKTLTVTAKDYEGNTAAPSIAIRIQPLNDPNAPVISWACSTNGALYPAGFAAKLRVNAIGNATGNTSNGIQKIEMFVNESTSPLIATAVSGLPNYYEATYTIPAGAVDGTTISVRAVATNVAGSQESTLTTFKVISGRVLSTNTTIAATDTTFDNQTLIVTAGTITITGAHSFTNLVVDGGKVVHTSMQKLDLNVTGTTYVACGAALDANDLGYGLGATYPGATASTLISGGSHIGRGGMNSGVSGTTFGSITRPQEAGGGAMHNGFPTGGGGVIRLVTASAIIDGTVRANGMAAMAAGGGSVWISAGRIAGKGSIEAIGSSGGFDAGGGGAIAIEYSDPTTVLPAISVRTDNAQANTAALLGGAGSIYVKGPNATYGDLVIDNAGVVGRNTELPSFGKGTAAAGSSGATLVVSATPAPYFAGHWIEISDTNGLKGTWRIASVAGTAVTLAPNANETINVVPGDSYQGVYRVDTLTVKNGEPLRSVDPIRIGVNGIVALNGPTASGKYLELQHAVSGTSVTVTGNVSVPSIATTDLTIKTGGKLTPSASAADTQSVIINATGNLTVETGASIDASDRGYGLGQTYPGATASTLTSGGSHIGRGGMNGGVSGTTFGSVTRPQEAGGGAQHNGFPTAGGGVVRINATNAIINGAIRANGMASLAAGGGSVWITSTKITGSGSIEANGSSGGFDAGGGGAIAVEYSDATSTLPAMTAKSDPAQANSATLLGGAGSIVVKGPSSTYGGVTLDNAGRTGQTSQFPALGTGVAQNGSSGNTLVTNRASNIPAYFVGHFVEVKTATGAAKGIWRIATVNAKTVTLTPNGSESINIEAGDIWRGAYRFDSLKLRTQKLISEDRLILGTAVDLDATSSIQGNNLSAPLLDVAKISLQSTSTGAAVLGTAGAVTDLDTPVAVFATNIATGNVYTSAVLADGSFAIPVQGSAGNTITFKARDANFFALESPVITVGALAADTPVASQINKTTWTADANFIPRTLSRDGNDVVLTGYPTSNGATDRLVVLNAVDPARPNLVRTLNTGVGSMRDVVVLDGWAYAVGDRFFTLDLHNPAAAPIFTGDPPGPESAVAVAGGYAFTSEINYYNDGRIHIYDVSAPSQPRYLRTAVVAGFGGYDFTDLFTYGTDYLIGISNWKPSNVGHDVMIIDRRDISNLRKIAEIDVPNFDAFRGALVGDKLYLSSGASNQFAVIDLSIPSAPRIASTTNLTAASYATAVIGNDAFVATATAGLTALDVTNPNAPIVTGANAIGGVAWDTTVVGSYIYTANETGLSVAPAFVAPLIELAKISMDFDGTMVTVSGPPQTITGNAPITYELTNTATASKISAVVPADGSFSGMLPAVSSDPMTIKATDAFGRVAGPYSLGTVPFGSPTIDIAITPAMTDTAFYTRNVATAGNWLAVSSLPTDNGSSDKLVLFDVTDRRTPVYKRTLASGSGAVRDVAMTDGWLFFVSDRLGVVNLNDPASTPIFMGDPPGPESAVEIVGGYAFTSEINYYNDGRIHIYDVSTPSVPRYLRTQPVAGIGGYDFTGLAAMGTDYLIGVSNWRPSNVGHDIMVIDRRDISNLKKVSELEIPNFEAWRVKAVGTTLYVSGYNGGVAVVDASNPAQLTLKGIVNTPGMPRGFDLLGGTLAVADGTSGATFIDLSTTPLPTVIGNQPAAGMAWDCAFNGATLYLAAEHGLAVIDNLGTAPLVDRALIVTTGNGASTATVTAAPKAVLGSGPMTLELRNVTTGTSISGIAVAGNGSFTANITATAGDTLTVKITDVFDRVTGAIPIGTVPFGTATTHTTITPAMSDTAFVARNISADGDDMAVASFPDYNGSSDKILLFDVSTPGTAVHRRTVSSGCGAMRDVLVSNGWLYFTCDRFGILDLNNPASSPIFMGDPPGPESSVVVSGGYAFTSEINYYNDGRIHIYDVSTPSAPRYLRTQVVAGIGGYDFTSMAALGTDYLVGVSNWRPSNVGHDIIVMDRRDINNLIKVSELEIPNFEAFRATVVGTTLYIAGYSGGAAIVDLSNPAAPVLKSVITSAAASRAIDVAGTTLAIANGGNGVSFIDAANPAAPSSLGATSVLGGSAWDVTLSRGAMYVASELGVTAIANVAMPPMIHERLFTATPSATSTAVTAAAQALTGITPITAFVKNNATNATSPVVTVDADGSAMFTIAALPGQSLTVIATDAAGRISRRLLPASFGATKTWLANPSVASNDTNYRARRMTSDGVFTVAATGTTWGTGETLSDKLLFFPLPGSSDPVRVVNPGAGGLQDVKIVGGYLYFVGDRFGSINLSDPTMTPRFGGDPPGREGAIAISGGYAFTSETDYYNDSRIHIYNVSNPATWTYLRTQSGPYGGLMYRSLVAMGTSYLLGLSPDRPGNTGHDLIVMDRTNVNNLLKISELEIAGFDPHDAVLDGSILYIAGGATGIAIVDLTNPFTPVLKAQLAVGNARGITVSGPNEIAVAVGSAGLVFVDVTDKTHPAITGTQPLPGNSVDVEAVGKTVHIGSTNYVHTVVRP
jgi:hypothetical protein